MTCLRRGQDGAVEKAAGGYLAVTHHHELPRQVSGEGRMVRHGYAVDAGGSWYFFSDLEPAIAFGRAARMSLDCRSYGIFRAAHETQYCVQHGDERVLVFVGLPLDRRADEPDTIARFAAGVAGHPESSYWQAPTKEHR